MASSCISQVATAPCNGAPWAARPRLGGPGTGSSSLPLSRTRLRHASTSLVPALMLASATRHSPGSPRDGRIVFAQAVSTTPGAEAEADNSEVVADAEEVAVLEESKAYSTPKKRKSTRGLKHLMQTLNDNAVQALSKDKEVPDIRPGDIVQVRVEVFENKKRVSLVRGIVIAKHNAGVNTTFTIRRVMAGVGVEIVFPLYSPNIKEIKVIASRKVRRAKLFYLRHKLSRLSTA